MSILARMPVLAAAMLDALPCAARAQDVARREAPPFFSYDELVKPAVVKHTITVFTDVNCGYCRKLHTHIDG